ncbi:hypothetical protein PLICRDRAFT_526242 [Plicaturopsis crispa FD-325 SS-3]|nr:hypothetical protein PLICRDRAFT_526242 [Plicaturopsis crispa FD-325 SS-3]
MRCGLSPRHAAAYSATRGYWLSYHAQPQIPPSPGSCFTMCGVRACDEAPYRLKTPAFAGRESNARVEALGRGYAFPGWANCREVWTVHHRRMSSSITVRGHGWAHCGLRPVKGHGLELETNAGGGELYRTAGTLDEETYWHRVQRGKRNQGGWD